MGPRLNYNTSLGLSLLYSRARRRLELRRCLWADSYVKVTSSIGPARALNIYLQEVQCGHLEQ